MHSCCVPTVYILTLSIHSCFRQGLVYRLTKEGPPCAEAPAHCAQADPEPGRCTSVGPDREGFLAGFIPGATF